MELGAEECPSTGCLGLLVSKCIVPEAYIREAYNSVAMLESFKGTIQNLLPNVHLEVNGLCSGIFCLNETQFYGIFNTS